MNRVAAQRLVDAWQQCLRHAHHMDHALAAVGPMLPLTSATVGALDDESVHTTTPMTTRCAPPH